MALTKYVQQEHWLKKWEYSIKTSQLFLLVNDSNYHLLWNYYMPDIEN